MRLLSFSCSILLSVAGMFLPGPAARADDAAFAPATQPAVTSPRQLWEGRFSQCSYNAVSSVLIYFYGPTPRVEDRQQFEQATFASPLGTAGFGGYYGWAPWTSYMVESGKMVWNGKPVVGLRAERFALRTTQIPELRGRLLVVHYQAGERERLEHRLMEELHRGPVVIWTPYAGALDAQFAQPWHHVSRLDENTDAVPFGPFTHSVTLYLREPANGPAQILVTDCSVRDGVYKTDAPTIVSTASAMAAFVRLAAPGEKSILARGLDGVKDDQYNVVFFRSPTTQPARKD